MDSPFAAVSLNRMRRMWMAGIVLVVLFVSVALVMVSQKTSTPQNRTSKGIPRILIDGDSDFDAEHGVVAGMGTVSDPYLIKGWDIDASTDCRERSCTGISVQNARVAFVISNVTIRGGSYDHGIRLSGVKNARVESILVTSGGEGIAISDSANVSLSGSAVVGDDSGVFVARSQNVWIYASNISRGVQGIVVEDSVHISLIHNVLNGNSANGLLFLHTANSTIEGNTLTETAFRGIALFNSSNILVSQNRILGCGEECLYVAYGGGTSLIQNEISNCAWGGVSVYGSDGNIVKGNFVAAGPSGIWLSDSSANIIASNTVNDVTWGISVASDSDANVVVGNTVSSSTSIGILLNRFDDESPDHNVIQGNRVWQSGKADLLDSSGGIDNLWRLNTCEKECPLISD